MSVDRGRVLPLLLASVAIGLLSGCSDDRSSLSAAPCVPKEAAAWLTSAPQAQAPAPTTVRLYADASGSMSGYLQSSTAQIKPLEDILALLPQQAAVRGDRFQAFRFGRTIQPVSADAIAQLTDPASYTCGQVPADQCENAESHIDQVLEHIAKTEAGSVSLVVTDLWLFNSDLAASGPVALGTRLSTLFDQGRSIDVVGVRAPYSGPMYDLPLTGTYRGANERPLFVLVIGPVELVEGYRAALTGSGSAALSSGRVNHALFTREPLRPNAAKPTGRVVNAGAGLRQASVLPPGGGLAVDQLELSRGKALEQPASRRSKLEIDFDLAPMMREGVVWEGATAPATKVWVLADQDAYEKRRCGGVVWREHATLTKGWSPKGGPATAPRSWTYVLDPSDALSLIPGQTFLLASQIKRGELASPNPATQWLRDWSFDFNSERQLVASQPRFFPTLNLGQTTAVIEAALQRSTLAQQDTVAGFATVVQSTDR